MNRYAMVLLNNVIGIVEDDNSPSWPPDPQGNAVITVECGDTVILGMVYDPETGAFTDYIPPAYAPTQLDRIEERIKVSYTEAQQTAVDAYTEELLEGGIL